MGGVVMRVDKVIVRAFLSTLAAIVILFAFMVGALCLIYPQTMMNITYDMGMERASIFFAEESYDRSNDGYYIQFATEVAIGEENYEKISSCGEMLIADDEFSTLCAGENDAAAYEQFIYGQVCVAKYELGKHEEAVNCAFKWVQEDSFPRNNAIVAVLITALTNKDTETVMMIKGKMEEKSASISETDSAYFNEVFALIKE